MSSASGDLPGDLRCSCLFALIVNKRDCCFRQSCRCHFGLLLHGDSLRLRYLRCFCNVFKCAYLDIFLSLFAFWYFQSVYLQISVQMRHVTFADSYLRANIEFRNKACTRGKYYSYTEVIFVLFIFIYVYRHIYVRHVLAMALASLP